MNQGKKSIQNQKSIQLLKDYAENGFHDTSQTTKETYLFVVEKFGKWLEEKGTNLEEVTFVDLQQYITNLQVTLNRSASTINKEYNAIKHFCRFLKRADVYENVRVVKNGNGIYAPKALNKNERNAMLREANRQNPRNYALVCFLLYTGVRLRECHDCDIKDLIDIGERGGYVKITGKNNKERVVSLNSTTRQALDLYLKGRNINIYDAVSLEKHKDEPLFKSTHDQRLSTRMIQEIVEKAGNTHPHALRHTCATMLLREKGYDPVMVAQYLGHANLEMMKIYAAASKGDMSNMSESLID